jgi:SAM-dependent methyltransferase
VESALGRFIEEAIVDIRELLEREPPKPWSHGGKIPWDEPGFSARMLREHLSQNHDLASRRSTAIDAQVEWLCGEILPIRAAVLDLGCGPGLYTSRLARLGHSCVGIDFSPASIEYARSQAEEESLDCTYRLEDLREADLGSGFDAVLLLYAEFNTFQRHEAEQLLRRIREALTPGGRLVLEVHTEDQIRALGTAAPTWYVSEHGLFSDGPHLCLSDRAWHERDRVSAERFTVFYEDSDLPDTYVCTTQAYTDAEYDGLLESAGLTSVRRQPSPADQEAGAGVDLVMVTAVAPTL